VEKGGADLMGDKRENVIWLVLTAVLLAVGIVLLALLLSGVIYGGAF
jgi:hypothetical protein